MIYIYFSLNCKIIKLYFYYCNFVCRYMKRKLYVANYYKQANVFICFSTKAVLINCHVIVMFSYRCYALFSSFYLFFSTNNNHTKNIKWNKKQKHPYKIFHFLDLALKSLYAWRIISQLPSIFWNTIKSVLSTKHTTHPLNENDCCAFFTLQYFLRSQLMN